MRGTKHGRDERDAIAWIGTRAKRHFLTSGGVVELMSDAAFIGHDGWVDTRVGEVPIPFRLDAFGQRLGSEAGFAYVRQK